MVDDENVTYQKPSDLPKEQYDLLQVGLPKWPQMRVKGKKITPEQAMEIIRRTDTFFHYHGGNAHDFNKRAMDILGLVDPHKIDGTYEDRLAAYEENEEWRARWGCIDTEYVTNGWISNCFIYGPSGWCHPDGTIEFVHNVGKWPSPEDIFRDWAKLVEAFPFIEADIVLMSGESCESDTIPVVGFRIRNGVIEVRPGLSNDWFEEYGGWNPKMPELTSFLFERGSAQRRECYFDLDQIQRWRDQVFGKDAA